MLGHGHAVDLVVRGHDAPYAGGHGDLEGGEVKLPQGAFGDPVVDGEAVGFGVVGDEVLHHGGDAVLLHARDVLRRDRAGQQRVLGVGLEVPAAERAAVQVDGRREQDVHTLAACLLAEQAAGAAGEVGVPGRGERGRAGQGDRRVGGAPARPAYADRPVAHHDRPQADLRDRGQRPHVPPGEDRDLGLEVERGQGGLDGRLAVGVHGAHSSTSCGTAGARPRAFRAAGAKSARSWSPVTDGTARYRQATLGGNNISAAGQSTWTDYTVHASVKPLSYGTGPALGISARYTDAGNRYGFNYSNGALHIMKRVGGVATVLATKPYTLNAGTTYTFTATLNGDALAFAVDGVQELTAVDGSHTGGKIALATYNATASFDDVRVTAGW
ncbi:hypothetical protein GCM10010517_34490 [Streptosporangium fragile]|uniref:Uncharacterized protein n=1 Tax=Streptosporangium fragile TaxID=46186 RepID=A0ABP6IDV9_9ACTN